MNLALDLKKSLPGRIISLVALVALVHLVLIVPISVVWRGIAALGLLGLPGALLALLVFSSERDPLTRVFLSLCGALVLPVFLLLALWTTPRSACAFIQRSIDWSIWLAPAPPAPAPGHYNGIPTE